MIVSAACPRPLSGRTSRSIRSNASSAVCVTRCSTRQLRPAFATPIALLPIVGGAGSAKRIDTVATVLHAGMTGEQVIDLDLAYENCQNGADDSEGVVVNAGETTQADVYVHADHMLWDQLGTEEATLAFQAWADADPYVAAGVYAKVTVKPFRKVLPA